MVFLEEGKFERSHNIHLSELPIGEEGNMNNSSIHEKLSAPGQLKKIHLSPPANNSRTEEDFDDEDTSDYSPNEEEYKSPANIEVTPNATTQTLRRSSRHTNKPRRLNDYILYNALESSTSDLITVKETCSSTEGDKWKIAMREEYDSLIKNKTWNLHDLPTDKRALNCKWVFKTKRSVNGKVEKYKARLVIKGCAQQEGIDYQETYAPVVRYSTIRSLLSLAVKHNLKVEHLDVVTAYLHGDLEEQIYMKQPEGFVIQGQEEKVCKLKKALYGLKQGGYAWNKKLNATLIKMNFVSSKVDQGVYIRKTNFKMIIIVTYVDDLLLLSNDVNLKNEIKEKLQSTFKMKDLGEASKFLGINISRDRNNDTISIDQTEYIEEILERFNMSECNPAITPLDPNQKLDKEMSPKTQQEVAGMEKVPYREALGALMFLNQGTRPDIASAITSLGRFVMNPGKVHWNALKRVFRYLKGTKKYTLTYYSSHKNPTLTGYSDADWAENLDTRRFTTGYVFTLQGGAISWSSKRQATVVLSTTEAEYLAIGAAC